MGFLGSGKKKKEKAEGAESQIAGEAVKTAEGCEMKTEEAETMSETNIKKKFMYLALDENGIVILDEKMQPVVSNVSEENAPINWPECAGKYAEKVVGDPALRVEVIYSSAEMLDKRGSERKAARQKAREKAKEQLFQLGADEITEAKRIKGGSSVNDLLSDKVNTDEKKTEDPGTKEKYDGNDDAGRVISAVDQLGVQINQDISNAVDDILGTIAENDKDFSSDIKENVQEQGRITDARTKKYIDESIHVIGQKTQKAAEDVSRKVNDAGRNISELLKDKIISQVNTVGKRMNDLAESVEGIEGNLTRLDQMDEIAALLRDKGINISMEIPPVNAEEEDIINLVRYSQKITEQLGYAARDLVRKREAFKNQAESNENEQKIMDQRIETARQEGIAEGKMQVIMHLLSKYADIDAIKDSTEDYVHVIWTILTELGVVIDGDGFYEKGKELEFSDEDIEKMMASYSKFDGAGKYRVVRTGLSFQGKIISAARFCKVDEEKQVRDSLYQTDGKQREAEPDEPESEVYSERQK